MERTYHEDELRRRLEHLLNMGYAVIEIWEVRQWWQRERITVNVYKEILETWQAIAGNKAEIHVAQLSERYVFITPNEFEPLTNWIERN